MARLGKIGWTCGARLAIFGPTTGLSSIAGSCYNNVPISVKLQEEKGGRCLFLSLSKSPLGQDKFGNFK